MHSYLLVTVWIVCLFMKEKVELPVQWKWFALNKMFVLSKFPLEYYLDIWIYGCRFVGNMCSN